ncbi:Palmitoyl-acyl carrier protein thioesterase, chloroplastic [Dichanthelium oligosanthes]|uniref:Acyl-[acyl-carrier-protein] hydrolase n=1 Tax=Dichanthelium oligosanthes TaxID=888268 RepID=A0A1E5VF65_9POAL|nr:Palmitoyl-acyl carrier protein thioesterase, chloroplastic [Dichanthelium oligosanthes]
MAGSVASSAFFPVSPAPASASKNAPGGSKDSLDMRGAAANAGAVRSAARLRAAVPKVSGGGKAAVTDSDDEAARPSAPRTFYNQLPDWSVLLAAITTIFLAAERQWTLVDWKPKRPDMLIDTFGFNGQVFRQDFSIRSYEIGADRTASIETLMNHMQETALNHVRRAGLLGDGFGSTPEMSKRNLFWVVSQLQVLVEQYPCWGDTVGIDTWVSGHGKNGMRRDWHLHDCNTGQTILRATSKWVMMHKHTRKLAKIPDEVRTEIAPYFVEHTAIADEDNRKLPKLPGNGEAMARKYVRTGLTPRWTDLDLNQHVNNVRYIGWILESAPISIFENHELASIVLDYKRECGRDSVLQSHTTVFTDCIDGSGETTLQCEHLLCLESGHTIVKARTMWRPKKTYAVGTLTAVSAGEF